MDKILKQPIPLKEVVGALRSNDIFTRFQAAYRLEHFGMQTTAEEVIQHVANQLEERDKTKTKEKYLEKARAILKLNQGMQ